MAGITDNSVNKLKLAENEHKEPSFGRDSKSMTLLGAAVLGFVTSDDFQEETSGFQTVSTTSHVLCSVLSSFVVLSFLSKLLLSFFSCLWMTMQQNIDIFHEEAATTFRKSH
jgi:hypothetical protein